MTRIRLSVIYTPNGVSKCRAHTGIFPTFPSKLSCTDVSSHLVSASEVDAAPKLSGVLTIIVGTPWG